MPKLGVNIDHVATLRQVRSGIEPEPVFAALICQAAGADSIVIHLREDRRHIKDQDLYILKEVVKGRLNLEMSLAPDIIEIAAYVKPSQATLVPENRQEVTTEGGLDVIANLKRVKQAAKRLEKNGISVSLFVDPEKDQITAAKKVGIRIIELHTGRYAQARSQKEKDRYFRELLYATRYAQDKGLLVNAGHGLDYYNVGRIAKIKGIEELNIGYSIVCRAVLVGLERAVQQMKELVV
ncbi:pyridoxine 5'-phosphate synthase [bacterium]|nr:MAG: pyridoxine 5'-phosphate synthase [bacterium]